MKLITFQIFLLIIILFNKEVYTQYRAEKIPSDHFSSQEFNFSIAFPNDSWSCSQQFSNTKKDLQATNFLFSSINTDIVYNVIVYDLSSIPEDWDERFDMFIRGMENSFDDQQLGWEIVNVSVSPSEFPLTNSQQFLIEINIPVASMISNIRLNPMQDYNNAYMHGYLVPGKLTYLIMTISLEQFEPLLFTNWVKSFRLINSNANEYKKNNLLIALTMIRSVCLVILLLTILVDLAFLIRKAMSKETVTLSAESVLMDKGNVSENVSPKKLTLWSKTLIIVILITTFTTLTVKNYSEGLNYSFGSFIGNMILPFIISFLTYGRKKSRDWNKFARLFFWLSIVLTLVFLSKR